MRLPDFHSTGGAGRRGAGAGATWRLMATRGPRPTSRSAVALIITVIMLSVITFLAVAFLALSSREKGSVKISTDQTSARLAADAALVRAQNELLAGILAERSLANFDLLASTNYVSPGGFTNGVNDPANVNYEYTSAGAPLNLNQSEQNLMNLLYSPRPPVFITNRFAPNSMEFRYYLDLNRNGHPDRTGFLRVTNGPNQPLLPSLVSNYVVGDPEWIGSQERAEYPHSPTNRFVNRFAYFVVPAGKTLDLNYIHNNAKNPNSANYYLRNQGFGSWELNLAAFLADLNTNYWNNFSARYNYYPTNVGLASTGTAFDDAYALWNWRRGAMAQASVQSLYGAAGVYALTHDFADSYSAGPVQLNQLGYGTDPDLGRTGNPWSGADMPNHYFTTQDLFDQTKVGPPFASRLANASALTNTYDQYTFYRLLSQLGTDSAPEDDDKLNLNYKNVGGLNATNFVPWTPLDFFTNAANRLLAKYSQDWLDADYSSYTNTFRTNQAFGISSIPVWVANPVRYPSPFVYTPSVHRLLQLAANIADSKTNSLLPSVFRPIFERKAEGLYIIGYEEVPTNNPSAYLTKPWEAAAVPMGGPQYINVYGVPWIVGAKQGLPNFNEISMHSLFEITRKLQVVRPSRSAPRTSWQTNMMYVIGVSNAIGVEAWNSYRTAFTNPVVISVSGDITMVLTNEFGIPLSSAGPLSNAIPFLRITNVLGPTYWPGYRTFAAVDSRSFVVPLRTNIAFLPESVYNSATHTFNTNLSVAFERGQGFPQPHWGLRMSGRLRFIMQLGNVNGPIIDYVQLDNLDGFRQLSEEIRDPDGSTGFDGLWSTNILRNSNVPQGVFNQLDVSLGNAGGDTADWKSYGKGQLSGNDKAFAIDYFRALYRLTPLRYAGIVNTSLVQQVPFSPTRRRAMQFSWQANDPLVHYTAGDLLDVAKTNTVENLSLSGPIQLLKNIGMINDRYSPWGGNPVNQNDETASLGYDASVKDPLVRSSDDWQFPTNVLPTLGWLGRIHRGTPWQTVYLKASDLRIGQFPQPMSPVNWAAAYPQAAARWVQWSGDTIHWSTNANDFSDAFHNRPVNDRLLFDIFTTAVNDNAARGRLDVNQTNLAAWSAVFSGVVALTNSSAPNVLSRGTAPTYDPLVIEPAGIYNAFDTNTWTPLVRLVAGINAERERTNGIGGLVHPGGWFRSTGDILSVPELTDASPYLSLATNSLSFQRGVNDVAYEWLPQQILSLLRSGEPRFVIYAYGQALRPAENSIITTGGQFFGLCTNYQITAEVAARAVVRVEGSPNPADANNPNPKRHYPPRLIVESYNYLPPE